jgi:hypothetical protein
LSDGLNPLDRWNRQRPFGARGLEISDGQPLEQKHLLKILCRTRLQLIRIQLDFLRGTLAPFLRASERPMAIACFRLFTVPPLPPFPDFKVPRFLRRIALLTDLPAAFPYLAILVSFLSKKLQGRIRLCVCALTQLDAQAVLNALPGMM